MTRPRIRLGGSSLAGLFVGVGLLLALAVEGKSFVFSRVVIDATVWATGSMRIVETRTYQFDGSFSWASYRLPLAGSSGVRDIRVGDERGPYTAVTAEVDPPPPGTFRVVRERDGVLIRWGFRATNESRTFTIAYVLDDVVTVYSDVAELYWKFIGTGWDRPSEAVEITVRLPGGLSAEQIRVWGHGPLQGHARPVSGGAVLTVRDLPAHTMVEGRIVFPAEVVPQARRRRAEVALSRIVAEETAWAEAANRARLRDRALLGLAAGLPVLALLLWSRLYVRHGREPQPRLPEGYYRELPAEYAPAELGVLWRFGSVQPADYVATILDLARRGLLKIEPLGHAETRGRLGGYTIVRTNKAGPMQPFEVAALAMLFGEEDRMGSSVTIDRRAGLPSEVRTRIGRGFARWTRQVRGAAAAHRFFDDHSARVSGLSSALGLILIAAAWIGLGVFGTPWAFGSGLAGAVMLLGSPAIRRRSQRGADDLQQWKGFRRFLLDFSQMPKAELPAVVMWEHYLVYAIPLGVADRVIDQLGRIYTAEELARSPGLRVWTGPSGSSSSRGGLAALATFTTVLSSATSSASSGSGRGGGFSGGGGRGGGGSGGSAG
jgi:hypothetical protein